MSLLGITETYKIQLHIHNQLSETVHGNSTWKQYMKTVHENSTLETVHGNSTWKRDLCLNITIILL